MLRTVICGFALLASSLTAQAAEVPVEAFPSNSAVVIRMADVDKSAEKVLALAKSIDPGQGEMVGSMVQGFSGVLINNPAKLGVKKGTDWWFAGIARKGNTQPALIIAVEPDDVDAIKDAVGETDEKGNTYTYVEYENWLLYSTDAEAMTAVKACIDGTGENISKAADQKSQTMIMQADVGVFINLKQIVSDYQDEIQVAQDNLDLVLDQAVQEAQGAAAVPGVDLEAIMDVYGDIGKAILESLKDLESCLIAVSASEEGLQFDEYLAVTPGSATSKFLAGSPTSDMKNLAMLPTGQFMYAGVSLDMAEMVEWSAELMSSFFGEEASADLDVEALVEKMKELEMGGYVSSFGLGDLGSGLFRVAAVYDVKDAAKARKVFQEMFAVYSSLDTPFLKQTMTYEEDAEQIGDQSVDKMTLKQEFVAPETDGEDLNPQQAQAMQMQQMAMQMMYGPEGAVSRMVYADNLVLTTTGGGSQALEAWLAASKSPQTTDELDATRAKLGETSNLMILFDLPTLIMDGVKTAAQFGLLPPGGINLDEIKPSYMGYSLKMSAEGLDAKTHIPATQMRGLYQIGMQGFMMYQQMQQPELQ